MLRVKIFQFNPFQENSYIIYNEHGLALIIDPGMYYDEEQLAFDNFINQQNLKPTQVINTHGHLDHIYGVQYCMDKYNITFGIHTLEQPILNNASIAAHKYQLPLPIVPTPTYFIEPQHTITLGTDKLKVLFTPGHSPGSISFYSAEQHFIVSGDVLFKNSIGRTDLLMGDFNVLSQSIQTQLYTLPPETIVFSGHGEPTTIGFEKANNQFVRATN
jgi:hydroxyacylglutathione hydrolase